jgi:tRNA(Ile)-lysidine synthase
LSGGLDSVVLLHVLKGLPEVELRAVHVHHGLSRNADAWASFCKRFCRRLGVPLKVKKVRVKKSGKGLEAAAREARHAVFREVPADVVALAHHLDDQAETVLMNLLRGAGLRGASGMASQAPLGNKWLIRPLLAVPREAILAYARGHRLDWIEDESNADESLTRNFLRRRVGPLLAQKFPAWKQALARAARLASEKENLREEMLRAFLRSRGLEAPSEAKLIEMLKQLTAGTSGLEHADAVIRTYRGEVFVEKKRPKASFKSIAWKGQSRLPVPALGGEIRFRRARGEGIDPKYKPLEVRLRSGGERLQPHPRRPRRTLKNLFQEAGVPSWARSRTPLLFHGEDLVWVAGLGVDARFRVADGAQGLVPEWSAR